MIQKLTKMYKSPHFGASMVSDVHGSSGVTPSDDLPYMKTVGGTDGPYATGFSEGAALQRHQYQTQQQQQRTTTLPPPYLAPPPAAAYPSQSQYVGDQSPPDYSAYTKLVKSAAVTQSITGVPKHVFKVRETTKLLLFLGVAAGGILMLDLTARLLISIAHNKCSQK